MENKLLLEITKHFLKLYSFLLTDGLEVWEMEATVNREKSQAVCI